MAQRAKRTYRGRAYTVKSKRPGRRVVHVRPYCRSPARRLWESAKASAREWGF